MEEDLADVGRCCCNNPTRCKSIQHQLDAASDKLHQGCFTIRQSKSPKIEVFRDKLTYWLGIPKAHKHVRVRKHHFSMKILEYLGIHNQHITTPISRAMAIKEGLLDSVECYKGNMYMFIPQISFEDAETQIKIRAKNTQQADVRKERIRIHMELVSKKK